LKNLSTLAAALSLAATHAMGAQIGVPVNPQWIIPTNVFQDPLVNGNAVALIFKGVQNDLSWDNYFGITKNSSGVHLNALDPGVRLVDACLADTDGFPFGTGQGYASLDMPGLDLHVYGLDGDDIPGGLMGISYNVLPGTGNGVWFSGPGTPAMGEDVGWEASDMERFQYIPFAIVFFDDADVANATKYAVMDAYMQVWIRWDASLQEELLDGGYSWYSDNFLIWHNIPEPASALLLGIGCAVAGLRRRRK
jgi:hypothetical protein